MVMSNDIIEKASEEFSERMKKYPLEVRVAMGVAMLNVMKGCPWGITTSRNSEFLEAYKNKCFANSPDKVVVHRIGSLPGAQNEARFLIIVNMDYFISVLNKESPLKGVMYSKEDLDNAIKRYGKAKKDLNAFMKSGESGEIGIFNTNTSSEIVVRGKRYPAFSVTLDELAKNCEIYGYSIRVRGSKGNIIAVKPGNFMSKGEVVYQILKPAPNGNALFIEIGK